MWQIEPVKDTRMPPVDATAVIFRASPVRADFDHAHPSPASQPHALPSHVSVTENLVKFIIVIDYCGKLSSQTLLLCLRHLFGVLSRQKVTAIFYCITIQQPNKVMPVLLDNISSFGSSHGSRNYKRKQKPISGGLTQIENPAFATPRRTPWAKCRENSLTTL